LVLRPRTLPQDQGLGTRGWGWKQGYSYLSSRSFEDEDMSSRTHHWPTLIMEEIIITIIIIWLVKRQYVLKERFTGALIILSITSLQAQDYLRKPSLCSFCYSTAAALYTDITAYIISYYNNSQAKQFESSLTKLFPRLTKQRNMWQTKSQHYITVATC